MNDRSFSLSDVKEIKKRLEHIDNKVTIFAELDMIIDLLRSIDEKLDVFDGYGDSGDDSVSEDDTLESFKEELFQFLKRRYSEDAIERLKSKPSEDTIGDYPELYGDFRENALIQDIVKHFCGEERLPELLFGEKK